MLTLEQRIKKLEDIASSNPPVVFSNELLDAHERRVENAKIYLDELAEVMLMDEAKQVRVSAFYKEVEGADEASIEFDGQFCKLALIQNWSQGDKWLLYLAPLTTV